MEEGESVDISENQLRDLSVAYYNAMYYTAMSDPPNQQAGGGDEDEYKVIKKKAFADLLAAVATDYKSNLHNEWFQKFAKLKEPPKPSWFTANQPDVSDPFPDTLFDSEYYKDVFFFISPGRASIELSQIAKTTNPITPPQLGGPILVEKTLATYIQTVCRHYFTTTQWIPEKPNHFVVAIEGANLDNQFLSTLKTILTLEHADPEDELKSALGCLNSLFSMFYKDGVEIGIKPNPQTPFNNLLMARAIMGLLVFYKDFVREFLSSLKYKDIDKIPQWYLYYFYFVKADFPPIIILRDMIIDLQNAKDEEETDKLIEQIVGSGNTEARNDQQGGDGDYNMEDEESAKQKALAKLMAAVIIDSKIKHHDAWFKNEMLKNLEPQGLKDKLKSWVRPGPRTNTDEIQTLSPWFPEILFDKTDKLPNTTKENETTTFHEGIFFFQAPEFASTILKRRGPISRVGGPSNTERALAEYIRTASKYYFSQFISDNTVDDVKGQIYADLVAGNDLRCAVKCLNAFFSEYAANKQTIVIDIPPNGAAPYSDILLSRAIIGLLHFSDLFAVMKAEISANEYDILQMYDAFFAKFLDDRLNFVFADGTTKTPGEFRELLNPLRSGGSAAATTGPASFAMAIVTSLAVVLTSTLVGAMT